MARALRIRGLLLFLFLVTSHLSLATSSSAQFLGYVANQGVQQNVFTNGNCASTLTSGSLNNIGQVGHSVAYAVTNGGPNLIVQIQGSADGVTYFQISNNAPVQPGIIVATGSYPFLRVQVTGGGAGCTITANYSGSTVATTVNLTGSNAQFMYQFNPFVNAAAGATANSANLSPPYGNAAGYLVFSYLGGAGPAASTIAIKAIDGPTGTTNTVATFNLATTAATAQVFPIPGYSANTLFLTYTAGGANANTFTVSYYFTYPGQGPISPNQTAAPVTISGQPVSVTFPSAQPVTISTNPVPVSITTNPVPVSGTFTPSSVDPCQSSGIAKSSAPINISTATTTQIVALVGGQKIYPCGVVVALSSTASAVATVQFEYGTGASCGTGTTAVTGAIKTTAAAGSGPISVGQGGYTLWSIPVSNAVCILSTGATFDAQGWLTYVQQ